jgi:hypothetical protein
MMIYLQQNLFRILKSEDEEEEEEEDEEEEDQE